MRFGGTRVRGRFARWSQGLSKTEQAKLWRAAARGHRNDGNQTEYERCARIAALIEGRPWKVDRPNA